MVLYQILSIGTFLVAPYVAFGLFYLKNSGIDLFYPIKRYVSKLLVKKVQKKWRQKMQNNTYEIEKEILENDLIVAQEFIGSDQKRNSINIKLIRKSTHAYVHIHLTLADNTYVLPAVEPKYCRNETENSWSCNGLIIENLVPYKRARMIFNGMLKDVTSNKLHPIKFHFLFNCCSPPLYFPEDANADLLADNLAGYKWTDGTWRNILDKQPRGYDQFGTLTGTVERFHEIDDKQEMLNLLASRSKYTTSDSNSDFIKKNIRIFLADSTGIAVNLNVRSFDSTDNSILSYGHVFYKMENSAAITKHDFAIQMLHAQNEFSTKATILHINFANTNGKYVINLDETQQSIQKDADGQIIVTTAPLVYTGHIFKNLNGTGIIDGYFHNRYSTHTSSNNIYPYHLSTPLRSKSLRNLSENLMVANFHDEQARIVELCGGKGTSLALMTSIHNEKISIPQGIILTVNAFNQHVKENQQIQKAIDDIEEVFLYEGKTEEKCATETCEKAVKIFEFSTISKNVIEEIFIQLKKLEEQEEKNSTVKTNNSYAVRSSAVGEDSAELSAAGQNRTAMSILKDDILSEVLKCWASVFAYRSVQYRWQHGLPIKTSMAVVIQKQIPSDAAGVLFTWHPSTLNPSQMVITSNFGIGETVVSGTVEPDTFTLQRFDNNQIEIIEKIIGSKQIQMHIVNDAVANSVLETRDNKDATVLSDRSQESLTDEEIIQLGEIGIILERAFERPVDIEWAFYKNHLYLLQCRPITTLTKWTNSELTHEFNTSVVSEMSVYTLANTGEVRTLPRLSRQLSTLQFLDMLGYVEMSTAQVFTKPVSALSRIVVDSLNKVYEKRINQGRYCEFGVLPIACFNNMVMIDVILGVHRIVKKKIDITNKIVDMALLGRPVINETIHHTALVQLGLSSRYKTLNDIYLYLKGAFNIKSHVKKIEQLTSDLNMASKTKDETAIDFYNKICKNISVLDDIIGIHTDCTSISIFWQLLVMSTLVGPDKDITPIHELDFANILASSNDVESAEIPIYLERIANIIANKGYREEFAKLPSKDGIEWLKSNCQEAYELLQEFLQKHGHRGYAEFEFTMDRWGEDPSKLVPMLQANVFHTNKHSKQTKSIDQIINELITPTNIISRFILKYSIKKSRITVGYREQTKSCYVRAIYKFKSAFSELAKKMVKMGLLPTENLIFHLSRYELGQLLENNGNPGLISKAMARQRLYPQWSRQKLPQICYGYPRVLPDFIIKSESGLKCKGTAACAGDVKARACVITNFEDVGEIQKGDILITYSTDICWSPYFPMLSGVVTELGGLISHGAVVAREYGLPCIVGAKNATRLFDTGDIVFLCGKTGEIVKL